MPNGFHPDDERLAAYAGNETDALRDRALIEHLDACARCGLMLDDLAALRVALGELPDIAPSRALRLIPPVPDPARRARGGVGWLRRLTAPVFVVGTGLVLIGAVGASGAFNGIYQAASAGAPEANPSADLRATDAPPAAQASDNEYAGGSAAQEPLASSRGSTDGSTGGLTDGSTDGPTKGSPAEASGEDDGSPTTPEDTGQSSPAFPGFLVLLLVGIGLVAVAAVMRFVLRRR